MCVCVLACASSEALVSHRRHSGTSSMATKGIVACQGQMKDTGECCRIRAGSLSLPERGPCWRGRAENSTAEGDGETVHINNRAKISL